MTGLPLAMVFFLFFFLLLIPVQQPIHVGLGRQKLPHFLAGAPVWEDVKRTVSTPGKGEDEVFADTMKVTAYRIYLLGVEDGMKGGKA